MGKISRALTAGVLSVAVSASCLLGGVTSALAADDTAFWSRPDSETSVAVDSTGATTSVLTTYTVRAGSGGPDYLGISNTNFDWYEGSPSSYTTTEFGNWRGYNLGDRDVSGLALWGSSVNENPNPFYANLLYNLGIGWKKETSTTDDTTTTTYTATGTMSTQAASTWMSNGTSWGDTYSSSTNDSTDLDGTSVTQGFEFGGPDIVYGATKTTNWNDADYSTGTNFKNLQSSYSSWNPTYTNNDSTNIWSQIYSMQKLGEAADSAKGSKTVRYNSNSATASALSYEKAIRGNLLYIASQIDTGKVEKKTVAYLYAIDSDSNAYFFTPEASGLLKGTDTGAGNGSESNANSCYASNNATIDLGYRATLPFITDTFTGTSSDQSLNITMAVESLYKENPAVKVASTNASELNDVDVIIYNTSSDLSETGTKGGKNSDGIINASALNDSAVKAWLTSSFGGKLIAGDDFGTSSNQNYTTYTSGGQSPFLYCVRNYTCDKNTRAAWAFSKVYPELYDNNSEASYCYWVDNVYHIQTTNVPQVAAYMEGNSDAITWSTDVEEEMEEYFITGYKWWARTGSKSSTWKNYAYYNGSSRASTFSGSATQNEPTDTIGIFAPSSIWVVDTSGYDVGTKAKSGGSTYLVKAGKKVYFNKAKNAKTVTVPLTVKLNKKKYTVAGISAKAFAKAKKCKTVIIKATTLNKKTVKGWAKGSKIKTVKVPKKKLKAYKKFIGKAKIAGKAKLKVKK